MAILAFCFSRRSRWAFVLGLAALVMLGFAASVRAGTPFVFSTGSPDGMMAMASRPGSAVKVEIEAGDDFVLGGTTTLTGATFTGLLANGAQLSSVSDVSVEIYRVFPNDSDVGRTSGPPTFSTPSVPTRVNSPADVAFGSRDSSSGTLTFTAALITPAFTAANSVLNGITPQPNQTTGGEGPVTGQEVQFSVVFNSDLAFPPGHYFFVPQVALASGDFFWLSAPKPIVPPGTPFAPDLQAWIRNGFLAPDWLRVGTDIVGSGAFNASFSLVGTTSTDVTPPMCVLMGTVAGPPKQIKIEVSDSGSGLSTVAVTNSDNASIDVPTFVGGSTSPLIVTATKTDASKGSTVALAVTDEAGNKTTCDPRWPATRLQRNARKHKHYGA